MEAINIINNLRINYTSEIKQSIIANNYLYAWATLGNYKYAFSKQDLHEDIVINVHMGLAFLGSLNRLYSLLEELAWPTKPTIPSQNQLETAMRNFEAYTAQTKLPLAKHLKKI